MTNNTTCNPYLAQTGGSIPCLKTETLPRLYAQLFAKPRPQTWAHLHDLSLDGLSVRCENHWTKTSRLLHSPFLVRVLGAVLGLALLALLDNQSPLSGSEYHLVKVYLILAPFYMALCALGLSAAVAVLKQLPFVDAPAQIQRGLALLRDSERGCSRALFLMEESDNAKTYRDAVLWTGRELRETDLQIMNELYRQDREVSKKAPRIE